MIEGLWSHIKRLTKNFTGLTITKINSMFDNDNEKKKYLDGWLCYGLLLRECEKKYCKLDKFKLLISLIKK